MIIWSAIVNIKWNNDIKIKGISVYQHWIGQWAVYRKMPYIEQLLTIKISFCQCTIDDRNVALPTKGLNEEWCREVKITQKLYKL